MHPFAFGGSPLLQQRELDFQSSEKKLRREMGFQPREPFYRGAGILPAFANLYRVLSVVLSLSSADEEALICSAVSCRRGGSFTLRPWPKGKPDPPFTPHELVRK